MIVGCGTAVVPEGGGATSSSSSTTGTPATTAMLDGTAPPDPSTSSSETSSTSLDPSDDIKLDTGVTKIETCTKGAELDDLAIVTPDGPFAATHAWWAWNYCCKTSPRLVLAASPVIEIADTTIVTPHVLAIALPPPEDDGPYVGAYDLSLRDLDGNYAVEIPGLDLLEPIASEKDNFVGMFAIDGADWAIAGTVDAPYCAAADSGFCPCE
jgi:hypothetical protein